jgi:hypothetical protein
VAEEERERDRQERARLAAEAAARRRAYAERPQPKLQTVYMSEDKRRMVEAALAALRLSEGGAAAVNLAGDEEDEEGADDFGGEGGDGDDWEADEEGAAPRRTARPAPSPALRQKLLGLGFDVEDVEDALAQRQCRTLATALDWCACTCG